MKKFILPTLLSVLLSFNTSAQISIYWDDDPGNTYNGSIINISKDVAGFDVYMHCRNTGTSTQEIKFRRVILNSTVNFSDQFCDNNLCYPCFGNDWTSPASTILNVGDSSTMKPTLNFSNGAGTAEIRYYILDASDQPIDSVDVNITCTVGIEEASSWIKNIYPNPTSEIVTIENSSISAMALEIYNNQGKLIQNHILTPGLNNLNVASFPNGNYSLNIFKQGQFISSKRLVIQH